VDQPPEQPFREFARELLLRFDRSLREFRAENDRRDERREAESSRRHAETMAHLAELREDMRDVRAESRATHQALLRILDRLDDGGGTAPAT
jgi:hypothetical protein